MELEHFFDKGELLVYSTSHTSSHKGGVRTQKGSAKGKLEEAGVPLWNAELHDETFIKVN